ncbi:MAG: hypothetical protein SF339_22925 [Blastocatellia bacterium]|jgi:hypothetical protein|nr:hypothetical protein [Blastocatellia bacterium]
MRQKQSWLTRLINRLRGRDPVAEYLAWLVQFGRVTEGRVLDLQQDEIGTTLYFRYKIANVDYETSQRLSEEQLNSRHLYVPGASITVRYDPKSPGSSIVT